jgi:hypothetical protein
MITIEKIRNYVPIAEKITMADKIVNADRVIDENGIINKNFLKLISTCFFVGMYLEDQIITTDYYDEIIKNNMLADIKKKIAEDEIAEWEEILANAVENVVETRKNASNNVIGALTSLVNSLNTKINSADLNKMMKSAEKILKNPDAVKNFGLLKEVADKVNAKSN